MQGKAALIENAEELIDDEVLLQEYQGLIDRLSGLMNEDAIFEPPHPLASELSRTVPRYVKRLSVFANMIDSFWDDPVFQQDILPRLNRPYQYQPARLELEIAYFIHNANVQVKFVDPKAVAGEQQHDLLISDDLPMEIKQLQRAEHIAEQSLYFSEIQNAVFKGGAFSEFKRAARVYRPLSEPEKDEFIERIERAIPRVKEGEIVEIRQTSLGELDYQMLLVPNGKEDILREWQEERDVNGPLTGPSQETSEVLRVKREIAGKVQQLPGDTPGVVLIEADFWLPAEDRTEEILAEVRELLKDVYDHDSLTSVVLLIRAPYLDEDQISYKRENVRIADFETHGGLGWRTFVTIHNKYTDDPEGKEIVDSLFSTQVQG